MATFKRFEEIETWQEARKLVKQEYVGEQRFNELIDQVEITARKLSKLIEYLRGSEIKGVKYKA